MLTLFILDYYEVYRIYEYAYSLTPELRANYVPKVLQLLLKYGDKALLTYKHITYARGFMHRTDREGA